MLIHDNTTTILEYAIHHDIEFRENHHLYIALEALVYQLNLKWDGIQQVETRLII